MCLGFPSDFPFLTITLAIGVLLFIVSILSYWAKNLVWVRHFVFSLITTLLCVAFVLWLVAELNMRFPSGLDEALAIFGIGFAALISVMIYMPEIEGDGQSSLGGIRSTIYWKIAFSIIIAIAGAIGGGVIRRWLLGESTMLGQPQHPWWTPLFVGWAIAFSLCMMRLNFYKRVLPVNKAMDEIDAWVMGVFAAAGAFAAAPWRPLGSYSDLIFVQLLLASFCAALTGAGGGMVARVLSRLTFAYGPSQVVPELLIKVMSDYVRIAWGVGTFAYIALRAIPSLTNPRSLSLEEFKQVGIEGASLMNSSTYLDCGFWTTSYDLLINTNQGNTIVMAILAGLGACYLFRNVQRDSKLDNRKADPAT